MARIACLLVPHLPLAAICRADPALAGTPLIVAEHAASHARVIAVARPARAQGIRPGQHTVAQARAIAARLVVRTRDPDAERSALSALADVAASLAPRLELGPEGAIFLDTAGTAHLTATEAGLASALLARAAHVGLDARVGIASTMRAAFLVARHGDGCTIVPAGTEQGFLAPFPLACLAPSPQLATTLERWGIRRLGDLARLPLAEVTVRLGAEGAALVRAARGEDDRPFAPSLHEPATIEESVALEWSVETLEPLLFVLRGLIERALARLAFGSLGCARLALGLGLADGGRDERIVPLAAPTREARTLLGCLRVALEARPPRAAITKAALTLFPEAIRPVQLGLFSPPGPVPERLATTLARLGVLCGEGRLGTPAVLDTHRPAAEAVTPFLMPRGTPRAAPAAEDAAPGSCCRLVARAFRPPKPLDVFAERDIPAFVRGPGFGGRVVEAAGPWRLSTEWWSEAPLARDYWDLELSDGGLYRCYRDLVSGAWFADGVYD